MYRTHRGSKGSWTPPLKYEEKEGGKGARDQCEERLKEETRKGK